MDINKYKLLNTNPAKQNTDSPNIGCLSSLEKPDWYDNLLPGWKSNFQTGHVGVGHEKGHWFSHVFICVLISQSWFFTAYDFRNFEDSEDELRNEVVESLEKLSTSKEAEKREEVSSSSKDAEKKERG